MLLARVPKASFTSPTQQIAESEVRLKAKVYPSLFLLSSNTIRSVQPVTRMLFVILKISQTLFTTRLPELSVGDRAVLARVLDKPTPDESEVQRRLAELCDILQHFR